MVSARGDIDISTLGKAVAALDSARTGARIAGLAGQHELFVDQPTQPAVGGGGG